MDDLTKLFSTFLNQQSQFLAELRQQRAEPSSSVSNAVASQSINFDQFDETKEEFRNYRQRLENYFELKQIVGDDPEVETTKTRIFINCIGSKYYKLLVSLVSPDSPRTKKYTELVNIIQNHLCPKPNIYTEQHKFLSRIQSPTESLAEYIADLRNLTASCNFICPDDFCNKSIASIFLRAQFIRGVADSTIRERLLHEKDLTFETATELALSIEASKAGNKEISDSSALIVNKVNAKQTMTPKQNPYYSRPSSSNRPNDQPRVNLYELGIAGLCLRCGLNSHSLPACRKDRQAIKCNLCLRTGHVARVCITSLTKKKASSQSVHSLSTATHNDNEFEFNTDEFSINNILEINSTSSPMIDSKFIIPISIGPYSIDFEADSGSPVSLISKADFDKYCIDIPLERSSVMFRTFTGEKFRPLGVANIPVEYQGKESMAEIYVVDLMVPPLLGRSWLRNFNITINNVQVINNNKGNISFYRDSILSDFSDVFEEKVGKVPNYSCSLKLKDDVAPIFVRYRQIPHALVHLVDEELDKLEKDGIIEQVDYAQWGSPLVVVPKPNNKVRLCVDYKVTINRHLQDARQPIPLIEDVLNSLTGGKVFCLLDIHKAYLHIPVDEKSQELQTISTHRGTYKMKRLSFGIKTAPNEFHKFIYTALQGLKGVVTYFDDIVICGESIEQCYERTKSCLERLRKFNLHINKGKSIFFASEIKYLGHVVNEEGIKKSPEKVEALLLAPPPKNIDEVRTLIGCVTYYSKFIKDVATILAPIYKLLTKKKTFVWSTECDQAFSKLKQELSSDNVLVRYDPNQPLILSTDASPVGLSAILSHSINGFERPIYYASRTLTAAEKNYSQLDREATAIYWGLHKFFPYVYGRKFTLVTDNKPLSHILNPDVKLPVITASRLLRYSMFLSGFNYDIKYKRSADHANADYLSRAPIQSNLPENATDEDYDVFSITLSSLISDAITLDTIRAETSADPELVCLQKELQDGTNKDTQFSLHEGVIFRGERVYIPNSLRPQILKELHSTHQGVVRMKSLARRYCYWPHIDKEIESISKSCFACAELKSDPGKVPLHHWEHPRHSWDRIHIDYAGPFLGCHFLIVVDAFSKWPEVLVTKASPTSESTINMLQEIFSRWGLPCVLVSDNASIFTSETFQSFCRRNGIQHKSIAPGHPATNGQAERFVRTIKLRLKALNSEPGSINQKLNEILFYYRATPFDSNDQSPAEMFLKKSLRTKLDLLKFQPSSALSSTSATDDYSVLERPRQLHLGERVQARNYSSSKLWRYGKVVKILGRLHYLIELEDGYKIRRHINQLRATEAESPRNLTMPSLQPYANYKTYENSNKLTTNDTQDEVQTNASLVESHVESMPECEGDKSGRKIPLEALQSPVTHQVPGSIAQTAQEMGSQQNIRRSERMKKPVVKLDL